MKDQLELPESIQEWIRRTEETLLREGRIRLAKMFRQCFSNTYKTTLQRMEDGSTFVITGDIPAMWLRDSAAQVRTYLLPAREDPALAELIEGVVRRQTAYILTDPYANAFNAEPNGHGHQSDRTDMGPWIWERKYEVDSLCYPLQLGYLLWRLTGRTGHLNGDFRRAVETILRVWRTEQDHEAQSSYRFERENCPPTDTLPREGKGSPTAPTGMTWSGFRPSDDACTYGYLIPANLFAATVLGYAAEMAEELWGDADLSQRARMLAEEIRRGVDAHGTVEHAEHGRIYAYETDGMGRHHLMDDANVPSLLALPYLGCTDADDPVYRNTRAFILSPDNPYYFEGSAAAGVGSPHTPDRHIWPIALAVQGLTADTREEKLRILELLADTDAGTGLMHESFHADDPSQYTRPWFSWANAMFSELTLEVCGWSVNILLEQGKNRSPQM